MLKNVHKHTILTLILTVFLSVMGASFVLAEGGSGSGGGKQTPLTLDSSDPIDGQKDVKLPVEIKLKFSKNVVNTTVRDKNIKGFTLSSADGLVIPIEVIMADDQMEPDKNQDVSIKPLQDLKPGTAYKVTIAPEVQSKSGAALGKESVLNFITAGTNPSAVEKTKDGFSYNSILIGIGAFIVLVFGFVYYKRKR